MSYNQSNGGAAALANAVATLIGRPYVFGGNYPPLGTDAGTDCSGTVQWAYNSVGVSLPRTTETQCTVEQLPLSTPYELGDCLFFTGAPSDPPPGHAGLFAGIGTISVDQHEFTEDPSGSVVIFNAPFTGDPGGIRYDYASTLDPVTFLTRPALLLPPAPPTPKPPTELEMAVITTDPNNNGKILLDPNTGNYYGFSEPAVEDYWLNALKAEVVDAPTKAVFAHLKQVGTI